MKLLYKLGLLKIF